MFFNHPAERQLNGCSRERSSRIDRRYSLVEGVQIEEKQLLENNGILNILKSLPGYSSIVAS
jgi:hypothetical protein